MTSARYYDDSMVPEFPRPPRTGETTELSLQVSINAALMRRLDKLEAETMELRKKIKNLEHMVPA